MDNMNVGLIGVKKVSGCVKDNTHHSFKVLEKRKHFVKINNTFFEFGCIKKV